VLDLFSGLQVALSLPMIIAAALFVLSLWNARHQDFGMQIDHVAGPDDQPLRGGPPSENHAVHRDMQARLVRFGRSNRQQSSRTFQCIDLSFMSMCPARI